MMPITTDPPEPFPTFVIIGELCPSTFFVTCLLAQLDSKIVINHVRCLTQSMHLLSFDNVAGAMFSNLDDAAWRADGQARRWIASNAIPVCALLTEAQAAELGKADLGSRVALFASPVTLAAGIHDFLRASLGKPIDAPPALSGAIPAPPEGMLIRLTRRQVDVLELLQRGYSSKRIAAQLGLTKGTVDNHVSGLLRALGASNRAHALTLASDLGLRARPVDRVPSAA